MAEQQIISFFSSDSFDLYKADVFRALALPEHYVLQFRYAEAYIDPRWKNKYEELKKKRGCIFFVTGNNDQKVEPSLRPLQFFSIREVTVEDCYFDAENTKQVYFYLKLGKFVNCTLLTTDPNKLPKTDIYVSEIRVNYEEDKHSWTDRINSVGHAFPGHLFFKIDTIKTNGSLLVPKYASNEKSSHYELADELNYQIEMQFCDLGEGKSKLTHDTLQTSALSISIPEDFQVNAYRDMRIFDIQTNSLSRRQESATIRFGQAEKDSVYNVDLGVLVKRGSFKPFLFGIFTLIAALGLLFGQLAVKKPEELQSPSIPNIMFAVLGLLCIGTAAGYLYQFFNKK